jgi:ABC-type nickel/cobalt efflux system permease component RcnA
MRRFPAPLVGALLVCLMLLGPVPACLDTPARAMQNPFTTAPGAATPKPPESELFSALSPVMKRIADWQNTLRQAMSRAAGDISDNPLGKSFWLFMGLAFAYGLAHALGPGHGKVLAVSYFLHRDAPPRQALLYAYLSMPLHVFSATVLVLGGKFLFQMSASRAVDDMGRVLQDVSYGLLAVMGAFMLASALRGLRKRPDGRHPEPVASSRGLLGLALATGLVPCPGAALVLIFSISLGITGAGMAAMVAIAMGMGVCLAAVSLLTIKFRETALSLMQNRSPLLHAGQCAFSLIGALVVLSTGSLLLLGSLANL